MQPVLDFLRTNFALFLAVALPLAGALLAIVAYTRGERDHALRISAATVLGICLYALLLT